MSDDIETFALLPTGLGTIGLIWNGIGLRRLLLPHRDADATRARLVRIAPGAAEVEPDRVPAAVRELLVEYGSGRPIAFDRIALDLRGVDGFRAAIYAAARALAYGETTTYGALAAAAGHTGLARETGQAMGSNPVPIVIPCHRVLAAGGKLGGFSAPGGSETKSQMLAMERATFVRDPNQASFAF